MSAGALPAKVRVLVVEDHPLFRQGVCQFLSRQKGFKCCGTADSLASAFEAVRRERPDLVLVDLRLRQDDASVLIRRIHDQFPAIKIIVLSTYDEQVHAERVLQAGAHGYVMKEAATGDLLLAMRTVLSGQVHVSNQVAMRVLHRTLAAGGRVKATGVESLSPRQFEVYQLLGAGLDSHEIASSLHLSLKTVQTHRENIKLKLGLTSAAALVRSATRWFEGVPVGSSSSSEPAARTT